MTRSAKKVDRMSVWVFVVIIIIIIINPLTARVVWAPQMILQPVFSIFPCFPLPSGTCQTPDLSIPWCCLPTSSAVCPVFFPLSLCLARWFWPDLINGRHDHTTAVCTSLWVSGGLCVVQLPAGSWHLVFFFGALPWGSMIHKHTGRWMWQLERISRILELREILLSIQSGFSFVNAAVVCAILESI